MNKEILGVYPNTGCVKVVNTRSAIVWANQELNPFTLDSGYLRGHQGGYFDSPQHPAAYLTPYSPVGAITAGTPTSGGSITSGLHSYYYTYVINGFETLPSAKSNVVDTTINKTVALSAIPLFVIPTELVGKITVTRNIYRTNAGDTGSGYLIGSIADNTTPTFTDTFADNTTTAYPTTSKVQLLTFELLNVIFAEDWLVVAFNVLKGQSLNNKSLNFATASSTQNFDYENLICCEKLEVQIDWLNLATTLNATVQIFQRANSSMQYVQVDSVEMTKILDTASGGYVFTLWQWCASDLRIVVTKNTTNAGTLNVSVNTKL